MDTMVVIPSMLSSIFTEFINPTTQNKVSASFKKALENIWMHVPVNMRIRPQETCIKNFKKGRVLYASSERPIKKASVQAANKPSNRLFSKMSGSLKKIE